MRWAVERRLPYSRRRRRRQQQLAAADVARAVKRVIAVGAFGDASRRASFSNYGPWVDACTAAVNILGPFPRFPGEAEAPELQGWAIWSGTSFAAPKPAGEIAARLSTRRFGAPRAAAALVIDPTRPYLSGLGTVLAL